MEEGPEGCRNVAIKHSSYDPINHMMDTEISICMNFLNSPTWKSWNGGKGELKMVEEILEAIIDRARVCPTK
jgi:hypothetical protein